MADEFGLISKEKMTSLADAVRQATGATGQLTVGDMTAKLAEMGGEQPVALRCYDYEGTIVGEYDMAEVMAMEELPACPEHDGLVSQGWNWTLASIKEQLEMFGGPVYIGALYVTDDGATRVHIYTDLLTFNLGFNISGTATIDWGDGSPTETVSGTSVSTTQYFGHTYAQEGRYVISISGGTIQFAGVSNAPQLITTANTAVGNNRYLHMGMVRGLNIGSNLKTMNNYALVATTQIEFVTVPNTFNGSSSSATSDCTLPFSVSSNTYPIFGANTVTILSEKNTTFSTSYVNYDVILPMYPPMVYPEYEVPDGTTEIPANAFDGKKYKSIRLPDSVTSIGNNAFYNNPVITSLDIPEGVTSIGDYAFCNCPRITEIKLPEGLNVLPPFLFSSCKNLRAVNIPHGVTDIKPNVFYNCTSLRNIVLPDGVETISAYVFSGCSSLKEVSLPKYFKTIGTYAFSNCYSLGEIELPKTITSIGSSAFSNCISLKRIINNSILPIVVGGSGSNYGYLGQYATEVIGNVVVGEVVDGLTINRNERSKVYVVTGYDGTTPTVYIGDREIEGEQYECVGYLGASPFANKLTITSVTCNIEYVPDQMFQSCRNLVNLYLGDKVKTIGTSSFDPNPNTVTNGIWNQSITNSTGLVVRWLVLPDNVESVGLNPFGRDTKYVKFGSGIKKIDSLRTGYLRIDLRKCTSVPALGNTSGASSVYEIVVPDNLVEEFKSATNWSAFSSKIMTESEYNATSDGMTYPLWE